MMDTDEWTVKERAPICQGETNTTTLSTSSSSNSQNSLHSGKLIRKNEGLIGMSGPVPLYDDEDLTSKSCDDLLQNETKKKKEFSRSLSCISLSANQSQARGKYDHIQSKVKQYIDGFKYHPHTEKLKNIAKPAESSKEEYLQEINSRLSRELEEKNALLQQLQENYEHLLLKYAEAQNKIDNLRLRHDPKDQSSRENTGVKSVRKQIVAPSVYPFKSGELSGLSIGPPQTKFDGNMDREGRIDRPSTLAVDSSLRFTEKAVTPTDSEGVSSVITSMSGHSKILTNLDDAPKEQDKNGVLKSEVLENVLPVNDPFDKVKNWQNSLPPLDMIETPDTALYDLDAIDPASTPSTRYNDFPLPDLSEVPETMINWSKQEAKPVSQAIMKKYLRTLSLPSSLTRRNMLAQIYKRRNIHTIDLSSPLRVDCSGPLGGVDANLVTSVSPTNRKMCCTAIIQKRKKRPPFLRSASLPVYDLDSVRSSSKNAVPPLDLDNLTLSEDDTSAANNSNIITSPSFITSHDCSFQTLESLNSCKATASDFSASPFPRSNQPIIHKSTSITPDRSKEMILFDCNEASITPRTDCCNVCGETVLSLKAASYQGIPMGSQESSPYMNKLPVHRSVSFTSESSSTTPQFNEPNLEQASDDPFDAYANSLKARSQVIMKALTAHVKNT